MRLTKNFPEKTETAVRGFRLIVMDAVGLASHVSGYVYIERDYLKIYSPSYMLLHS